MTYDEDITKPERQKVVMVSDDACKFLIIIITLLIVVIGLPSLFTSTYEDNLPGILALGLVALVLSILYLGMQVEKLADSKT